jgi:hypothetical protein
MPFENGTSGSSCASASLPIVHQTTGSLLGGRTNTRRALRRLLKDLNAQRLSLKE